MNEKEIKIEDNDILNRLALSISEERCSFSVLLKPNIPEIIEINEDFYSNIKGKYQDFERWLENAKSKLNKGYTYDRATALYLADLSERNGIMPFMGLKIRGEYGLDCEIEFENSDFRDNSLSNLLRERYKNPNTVTSGKKWYSVYYDDIKRGEKKIDIVRDSMQGLIKNGYTVTYLSVKINPSWRRGVEYSDIEEYDGFLRAKYNGKIIISGKNADDFDINDIPREYKSEREKKTNILEDEEAIKLLT